MTDRSQELAVYVAFLALPESRFPEAPFQLNPWTRVNDSRWFDVLRKEITAAVDYLEERREQPHPRQRTGALLRDLRYLKSSLRPAPCQVEAAPSTQFQIGERVAVRGLGEGPVYREAGPVVWVCLGNSATPHDRADVVKIQASPRQAHSPPPEPQPAPEPAQVETAPSLSGSELWRLAGLSYYSKLRDTFAARLEADPTAHRRLLITKLDSKLTELAGHPK